MNETAQEWVDALAASGIQLHKTGGRSWAGPCPACGGDDRFHVKDVDERALVGCRGCIDGQTDGSQRWAAIRRDLFGGAGGAQPTRYPERKRRPAQNATETDADRIQRARDMWGNAEPIPKDAAHPARRWVASRTLWEAKRRWPDSVRWLPGKSDHTGAGAICAAVAPLADWRRLDGGDEIPDPAGVHCVSVDAHGQKALDRPKDKGGVDKRTYGALSGHCGYIAARSDLADTLYVVEGLADGLKVAKRAGLPVAVCCGTAGMCGVGNWEGWQALNFARVIVLPDGDGAGQEAAKTGARVIKNRHPNITVEVGKLPDGIDPAEHGEPA